MSMQTQLTHPSLLNVSNITYSEPITGSIPSNGPSINFKRINISIKNPDGSIGDLILPTSKVFSFGVSENKSPDSGKVNGWTLPLCLHNKNGPSDEEKEWVNAFNKIVDRTTQHIIENREEIDKFELEKSDLRNFNPLYYKKEKHTEGGKTVLRVVPGTGPTLYTKLIYSKKTESFVTKMYDNEDNQIDPLDMIGKYCYCQGAVKIESIFIGNKISLQVKLYEAVVDPISNGSTGRLLARPAAKSMVIESNRNTTNSNTFNNLEEDNSSSDDGSIMSDDELEMSPSPPKKKSASTRKKK